jgi:hypothetical protein
MTAIRAERSYHRISFKRKKLHLGTDVTTFKIFWSKHEKGEKSGEKMAFLTQTTDSLCKNLI